MRQGGYYGSLSERGNCPGRKKTDGLAEEGGTTVLISARTTFALRCPQCGQMEAAAVSRFQLAGGRSLKVSCSCGGHKLTIGAKHGQVAVQIPCYLCDGIHFMYDSSKRFWHEAFRHISCSETELQLGAYGQTPEVEAYARPGVSDLDRLLEDAAFDDYFDHPEIMYQALNLVHNLAEQGSLACACGNPKISVDIYPDRLELICLDCGRHKAIMAATEADLTLLELTTRIEVGDDTAGRRKGHNK